jgi:hypothetical protein
MSNSVIQPWVNYLTLQQQTVMLTALRGPDGLPKNHVAKRVLNWMRRCILKCAYGGEILSTPYEPGGGSFMRELDPLHQSIGDTFNIYLDSTDELPLHFHLHLIHAAEVLAYKHPHIEVREQWKYLYTTAVKDLHMNPETELQMDRRLSDGKETNDQ